MSGVLPQFHWTIGGTSLDMQIHASLYFNELFESQSTLDKGKVSCKRNVALSSKKGKWLSLFQPENKKFSQILSQLKG